MSEQSLPTGRALDARARRLMKSTTRVDLTAGGSYTLRKLRTGAISEAGELISGMAEAAQGGDAAMQRFVLANLGAFVPLVAAAIVEEDGEQATLTPDEVAEMEFDDFAELVAALDFGDAGGADVARRGFPADAGPAGVGAGGSDDPDRA